MLTLIRSGYFLAQMVDSWRIFPRLFLSVYIFLLYFATMWFMDLPEPSLEQSGLISVLVGAGAAWFGLYAGTHKAPTAGQDGQKKIVLDNRLKFVYNIYYGKTIQENLPSLELRYKVLVRLGIGTVTARFDEARTGRVLQNRRVQRIQVLD